MTDHEKLREAITWVRSLSRQYTGHAKTHLLAVCSAAEAGVPREPEYQWEVKGWRGHSQPELWILPTLDSAESHQRYLMRHTYIRVKITRQEKPA